jgi:hypothetical protein
MDCCPTKYHRQTKNIEARKCNVIVAAGVKRCEYAVHAVEKAVDLMEKKAEGALEVVAGNEVAVMLGEHSPPCSTSTGERRERGSRER